MAGYGQQSIGRVSAAEVPAEMVEGGTAALNEVDLRLPAAQAASYSPPAC